MRAFSFQERRLMRSRACCKPMGLVWAALAVAAIALAFFTSVLFALTITGCQGKDKRYNLRGLVLSKNIAASEITVKHEEIPGFMPAMTMPYKVKDPRVVQELKPGDIIAAELVAQHEGTDYWLEDIRIVGESEHKAVPVAAKSRFLAPGEHVPDFILTNQDGKTFKLSDFRGKAVLITFIYTRCPMPNFCPRLSSQFAKIHADLRKTPDDYDKTHLLTVSFDPKYDTAPVLRKYGLAYLDNDSSGFSHWDFAFTGPGHLRNLAEAFGLEYFEEDNQITHTMNIVLIKPDGTIAKYWSTTWTASELEDALREAAQVALPREANQKRYQLDGVVVTVSADTAELTIRHKEISGYMPAMTMPYRVDAPQALAGVSAGDHILADLVIQGNKTHLENITVTRHAIGKESR